MLKTSDQDHEEEYNKSDHETNILIYNIATKEWQELGDVPYLSNVLKQSRPTFYSEYLNLKSGGILLVASSATSEIVLLVPSFSSGNNDVDQWDPTQPPTQPIATKTDSVQSAMGAQDCSET